MSLIVCPASQVERVIAELAPTFAISLISPGAPTPNLGLPTARHLILRFNDIGSPQPGLVAPDADMVAGLLAFAADCGEAARLLIHCYAGISRSPAAAYAIACARAAPGQEAMLAERLRRKCPSATPNPRLIAVACAQLDRAGAMTTAIAAIGRGRDAFEGELFELG